MQLIRGVLGTTLLGAAATTAHASPCDEDPGTQVMLLLGLDVSPRAKLVAGIEARHCITSERNDAVLRFEIGGGAPRLIAGARIRPFETMNEEPDGTQLGLEAGALIDRHARFGLHGAATLGPSRAYASAQFQSLVTDPEAPTRFGILGALAILPFPDSEPKSVPGRPITCAGGFARPRVVAWRCPGAAEERAVRDHFATAAQLELSSVWTFVRLAAELAAVGAPARLVVAALAAADDELRHTALCATAAGGLELALLPAELARPRFAARSPRALATLAREAWLEGCLNEGAAAEEARLASAEAHGAVASMLAVIARDETGHAELSWAVLEWLFAIAPDVARAAISATPARASERARRIDPALARRGVPSADVVEAASEHATRVAYARLAG